MARQGARRDQAIARGSLRPHIEAFIAWVASEYCDGDLPRGSLRSALGYAHQQKDALMRFLDDGRLVLDNNRSERALRSVAVGRKARLFVGSNDHAESTSHLFTLVASAKLHGLDAETYLRDVIRVLPHWPRDRYLELAPLFWSETHARLDAAELAAEIGALTVPERRRRETRPSSSAGLKSSRSPAQREPGASVTLHRLAQRIPLQSTPSLLAGDVAPISMIPPLREPV